METLACDSNGGCKPGHLSLRGHTNCLRATDTSSATLVKDSLPLPGRFQSGERTPATHQSHETGLVSATAIVFGLLLIFTIYRRSLHCICRHAQGCTHAAIYSKKKKKTKNKFSKIAVWKTTSCSINTHILQYYITIFFQFCYANMQIKELNRS